MLSQASLFENLLNNASNQKEKELIIELFNIIQNFYYILDIYENCNINTKIFNYLFVISAIYTIDEIATFTFVNERTVRRFKKKTEDIIKYLIENCNDYKQLNKILYKHKNT